jgi:hypothetical protein
MKSPAAGRLVAAGEPRRRRRAIAATAVFTILRLFGAV